MYRKKLNKEILFSNFNRDEQEEKENPQRRSDKVDRIQLQRNVKIKINYKFNQYVKLYLCKMLPNSQIIIAYQDSIIFGAENKCRDFINQISKQFKTKAYKKIKFKVLGDLDLIEYYLHDKYDFKIFRPKVLQLVTRQLNKIQLFKYQCMNFLSQIKEGSFLLRIDKQKAEQCVSEIINLLRQKERQRILPRSLENEQQQLDQLQQREEVQQKNIYDLIKQSNYKNEIKEKGNGFNKKEMLANMSVDSQHSRQFVLNQTNSDYEIQISETNSSFFVQNLEVPSNNQKKLCIKFSQSFA